MTIEELLVRPAGELAGLVRAGEVSARELVVAALNRADDVNDGIGAFCLLDEEGARAATEEPASDGHRFAGVPTAVKDMADQAGLPCRRGSYAFRDYVASKDAFPVALLRGAGFISIGKTTTPEFGILPTTEPRLTGPTRNPWDTTRTPGGSSGGAAAAVAAGVVPLAHGGDAVIFSRASFIVKSRACVTQKLTPRQVGRFTAAPAAPMAPSPVHCQRDESRNLFSRPDVLLVSRWYAWPFMH